MKTLTITTFSYKQTIVLDLKRKRENLQSKSYIRGNKLFINDTLFTVQDLLEAESTEKQKSNSAPPTPQTTNSSKVDIEK